MEDSIYISFPLYTVYLFKSMITRNIHQSLSRIHSSLYILPSRSRSSWHFSNQNLWQLRLPMCQLILNSTYSSSRRFSPFFLTFFRHARLPYHALLNAPLNYNEQSEVAEQLRFSRHILKEAEANIHKQFENTKKLFDRNSNSPSFPVGCKLFVRTSQRGQISFKLAHQWKGPYICL